MTSADASPTTSDHTATPFRFKRKHSSACLSSHSSKRRRHHHHRHHRHRAPNETSPASTAIPNDHTSSLDSETAFRESLFDAMADDEGAAFWEGVYGQPIHVYAPNVKSGVDAMDEEEYVAWVRAKMWEKSREGVEAARQAKAKERMEYKAREDEQLRSKAKQRIPEEEARREERRRQSGEREKVERDRWDGIWEEYLDSWEELKRSADERGEGKPTSCEDVNGSVPACERAAERKPRDFQLVWPVRSGRRKDIATATVEDFVRNAPPSRAARNGTIGLLAVLKAERVRWHPDKVQQRFGSFGLDERTIRTVTTVFQILDRMWGDARNTAGN